jgi:asparagine synthase (glutamine-hydrolysing)
MIQPFAGVISFDSVDEGAVSSFKAALPFTAPRLVIPNGAVFSNDGYEDDRLAVAFSGLLANACDLAEPDVNRHAAIITREYATGGAWHERLWGEYAVAVHDKQRARLFLLRDRVGFYPLYWACAEKTILFASAARHLFAWPGFTPRPHAPVIARFLGTHYRHLEGDRRETAFEGVFKVPPGTLLAFDRDGLVEESYWDERVIPASSPHRTEENAAEELRALLGDAVERRLEGDPEELGFAMSSGMDSSSILALAAQRVERPRIFTTSFSDRDEDEARDVKEVAERFGRWQPILITEIPDFLEAAEELHRFHDEPVVTVTWLWDYLMQRAAAEAGVRIFFGGLGGDELFAGEFEHFFFRFADLAADGEEARLDHEIERWICLHDHPVHKKSRELVLDIRRRMDAGNRRVKTDPVRFSRYLHALAPDWRAAAGPAPELENPWRSSLTNRLWQDLRFETTLPCLRAAVMNAAAFDVEIRFPFLDHRVVEAALPLPGEWKIRDGVTKRVLRRAMRGILPDSVIERTRKMGWSSPADRMFRGPALEKLQRHMTAGDWRTRLLYDEKVLRAIIEEHRLERADHSMFLWQFAAVEAWWKRWFK